MTNYNNSEQINFLKTLNFDCRFNKKWSRMEFKSTYSNVNIHLWRSQFFIINNCIYELNALALLFNKKCKELKNNWYSFRGYNWNNNKILIIQFVLDIYITYWLYLLNM